MKPSFSILLLLFVRVSFAQVVAVQNDKRNVLYTGTDNMLTIAVQECPYDTITAFCDNCEILPRNAGDHNHYIVHVDSPGHSVIEIKKKTGKEYTTVTSLPFRDEYRPDPNAYYARKQGGEISLSEINDDLAPYAKLPGFGMGFGGKYLIDSFTVIVLRDDKAIYIKHEAGSRRMSDSTLAFFRTMRENDKLLFTGITCRDRDKRLLHLAAMEFVIKNTIITVNGEEKKDGE